MAYRPPSTTELPRTHGFRATLWSGRWLAEFVGPLMDSYQQLSAEKDRLMVALDAAQEERQRMLALIAAQRAETDALRALIRRPQAGGAG